MPSRPLLPRRLVAGRVLALPEDHDVSVDARTDGRQTDDPPRFCNPLGPPGQQGCANGLKGTWVRLREEPSRSACCAVYRTVRCHSARPVRGDPRVKPPVTTTA